MSLAGKTVLVLVVIGLLIAVGWAVGALWDRWRK